MKGWFHVINLHTHNRASQRGGAYLTELPRCAICVNVIEVGWRVGADGAVSRTSPGQMWCWRTEDHFCRVSVSTLYGPGLVSALDITVWRGFSRKRQSGLVKPDYYYTTINTSFYSNATNEMQICFSMSSFHEHLFSVLFLTWSRLSRSR